MAEHAAEIQNNSKLAFYRGLIGLAWADHELHSDEKQALRDVISHHRDLSETDRNRLLSEVDEPISLETVWPEITDPQDRARLIDMANAIFQKDGEICDHEWDLIETFRAKHLSSIGIESIKADLASFAGEEKQRNDNERQEIRDWARQYSLVEQIKGMFDRN